MPVEAITRPVHVTPHGARAAVLFLLASLFIALSANASIVHRPHFKVDGMVIVWGGTSAHIANGPANARAGQAVEITPTAPVITATLIALAPPQIPLRQTSSRFFVASNTAFSIDAELTNAAELDPELLKNTRVAMAFSLTDTDNPAVGSKAQYPHSAGPDGGLNLNVQTLADLQRRTTIFSGNQRTARTPGSIAEQSVQFELREIPPTTTSADGTLVTSSVVTFTVYIP